MSSKLKGRFTLVLKLVVAVTLVAFLIRSGRLDPKDLWNLMTFKNVSAAFLLVGLNLAVATWRWILLLRSRGFQITFVNGLRLYLIGVFFNHALPGSVGGDVVRGYYLVAEHPGRRLDSVLSVFIDRVLGLYSFFILTLGAAALDFDLVRGHEQLRLIAGGAALIFVGMTGFFTVVFSERLSRRCGLEYLARRVAVIQKIVTGFQRFGRDRLVIFNSVLVSLLAQVTVMLFFYQLASAMNESAITMKSIVFAVPMGFLITAVPIAPAGIGVGQWAFSYLFQVYAGSQTQFGATAVTAFQLTLLAWGMVGAVVYLRRGKPRAVVGDSARENPDLTNHQVR